MIVIGVDTHKRQHTLVPLDAATSATRGQLTIPASDDGLVDRRMGQRSPRRAPEEELERMLGLFRDKYADFTVKHFHEQLQKRHNYVLGYTVTKLALHAAGLVRKAPKRSAHRKKRPRRPLPGMLLHQDGSRHPWIEGLPAMDLIVTMTMRRARSTRCCWSRKKGRRRRSRPWAR